MFDCAIRCILHTLFLSCCTDSRQSSFNDRRGMWFCALFNTVHPPPESPHSCLGSFGGGFGDRRGSGFSDRGDRGDRGGYDRGFGDRGFDRHDSRGSAGGSFHERRSGGFGGPDRRGPPDSPRGGRGQYGGGSGGGSQHGMHTRVVCIGWACV